MNGYLSFLDNKYSIPPEIMIKQIRYVYGYGRGIIGTASISREVYSYKQHINPKKITKIAIIFNLFSSIETFLHQILCKFNKGSLALTSKLYQLMSKTEVFLLFKNIAFNREKKDGGGSE